MRSIHFRLMIFFCSLLILTLVTMGIYSYRLSSSVVEEKTSAAVLKSLEQQAKNLDVQMRTVKKYMDLIIYTPEFMKVVETNSFDKTSYQTVPAEHEMKEMLDAIFFEDDMVKDFAVFKDERLVYKYGNGSFDDKKFKGDSIYKNTIAADGALYFGGTIKSDDSSETDGLYLCYGRKLTDYNSYQNTDVGSVFLFMDIKSFSAIINDTIGSGNGKSYITDNEGNVLASQDKLQIFSNIKDRSDYRRAYESNASGYYIDEQGRDTSVITFYTLPKWNLKIVQSMPRKDFIGETSNIIVATLALSMLMFAILVVAALFLSRSVARPVKKIKAAMKNLQDGNFDARLDVRSRDEFGSIAVSFNYMAVQLKELLDKLIKEERRRNETEISMLQYQINPHFLYNVLATIRLSAVSHHDQETAEMLQKLSRLLKRTLANAGRMVSLETELCNINDFVDIQKVLYNDKINVVYDVCEQSYKCLIPNMLLQPLVENSILHGFGDHVKDPEIRISSRIRDGQLQLVIEDNGLGMSEETIQKLKNNHPEHGMSYNGIGLTNVNMRIKLYFGEECGLRFESSAGRGTKAIINLNYTTDDPESTYIQRGML